MRDEPALEQYFSDLATAALVDAERYASQGRRARAQDSIRTAQYFAVKSDPLMLPSDFEERLDKVYWKSC